ncbi:peptidoglycan-binding domain-containing protein [Labrys monachus]|uniref:Peptidoglycan hydrolase-like protein with peptidoglycan-binding domain n=1 Tax=Labrys monachus TaxID=217067 RepID=A0ABU0FKI5_9HYPH|nr:peptidoglycan-binding protein [Labrys monachus]MDQ0394560.1 peptidoglycan hydrolase-like protein with peptidoglycan-binding domain [Labrys monachus]
MREALARSDRDFLLSDTMEEVPSRLVGTLRFVLQRPAEVVGLVAMVGFGTAILVNALALQTVNHASAPFLAEQRAQQQGGAAPSSPARADSAAAADQGQAAALADQQAADGASVLRSIQAALAERGLYDGQADGMLGPKTNAAIRSFQQHNGLAVDGQPSADLLARILARSVPIVPPQGALPAARPEPADPIAALIKGNAAGAAATSSDKRILAVEKALAKQGYGPLKLDGILGGDTRNAIGRFEKDRGLPVTGQISPRLLRELALVTGSRIE